MWHFPRWSQITAAIALVLLLGLAVSPHAPHQRIDHSSRQGASETEDSNARIADYTEWLAILTFALVVTASVQIYFLIRGDASTRVAADAAAKSANLADVALHLTQRARIHVSEWRIEDLTPDTKPTIRYQIANGGPTEARLDVTKDGYLVDKPWPSSPVYEADALGLLIVPGNSRPQLGSLVIDEPISGEMIAKIMHGKASIRVWGRARYLDIFGDQHRTGYAVECTYIHGELECSSSAPAAYYFAT